MNLQAARLPFHNFSIMRSFAGTALLSIAAAMPMARASDVPDVPPETPASIPLKAKDAEPQKADAVVNEPDASSIARDAIRSHPKADTVVNKEQDPIAITFTPRPENWETVPLTQASQMFREIEKRVNATNPEFPITIMDDDSINLRYTQNDTTFRNRFYEVIEDRGITLRWNTKSDVLEAMGGLKGPTRRDPVAIRVRPDDYSQSRNPLDKNIDQKKGCIVITPVADSSSRTLVEQWLGNKSGPNKMISQKDPGPYALMLRATWHEVWHCIDTDFYRDKYIIEGEPAIDNALRMHKAEMFVDMAATLTLAVLYPELAQDMADLRAINSHYEAPRSMRGTRPSDEAYYDGITYYLTKAQDLMQAHIKEAGVEAVSKYTLEDIRRIARNITNQGAMTKEEFRQMAERHANGAGPTERVKIARDRMLADSGIPVPPKGRAEEDHYNVNNILRDMPAAEKESIATIVKERADAAVAKGQRPEQGLVELIDEWRREVHGSERKPEIERKLYVLSIMLPYGHLEKELRWDKIRQEKRDKAAKALAEEAAKKAAEGKTTEEPNKVKANEATVTPVMEQKAEQLKVPELPKQRENQDLKREAEPPLQNLESVNITPRPDIQEIDVRPVEVVPPVKLELNLNLQLQLKIN